jgi:hypothetical protein
MRTTPALILATAALTVLAAGCSSDDATRDDAAPTTRSAGSSTTTPTPGSPSTSVDSPTPAPTHAPVTAAPPTGPEANCLLTVPQVSRVLSGEWTRSPRTGEPCAYNSDRGGVLITQLVQDAVEPGLRDARGACLEDLEPITLRRGHLVVCVERHAETGQIVVGNVVSRGLLWLAIIPTSDDQVPDAQLAAMVALMQSVPA